MIYKAKEGSEAYNYLKDICESEKKEHKAYFDRVEKAIGFEVKKHSGYLPNDNFFRTYEIVSLLVDDAQYEKLDKKVWKDCGIVQGYHKIEPNKRYKQGKEISKVLSSYESVATFNDIHNFLGVPKPNGRRFTIPQLVYGKGHYFVYFDDSVRADKYNDELEEITVGQYEDMIKEE